MTNAIRLIQHPVSGRPLAAEIDHRGRIRLATPTLDWDHPRDERAIERMIYNSGYADMYEYNSAKAREVESHTVHVHAFYNGAVDSRIHREGDFDLVAEVSRYIPDFTFVECFREASSDGICAHPCAPAAGLRYEDSYMLLYDRLIRPDVTGVSNAALGARGPKYHHRYDHLLWHDLEEKLKHIDDWP